MKPLWVGLHGRCRCELKVYSRLRCISSTFQAANPACQTILVGNADPSARRGIASGKWNRASAGRAAQAQRGSAKAPNCLNSAARSPGPIAEMQACVDNSRQLLHFNPFISVRHDAQEQQYSYASPASGFRPANSPLSCSTSGGAGPPSGGLLTSSKVTLRAAGSAHKEGKARAHSAHGFTISTSTLATCLWSSGWHGCNG